MHESIWLNASPETAAVAHEQQSGCSQAADLLVAAALRSLGKQQSPAVPAERVLAVKQIGG